MANTRQSGKRARQALKRQSKNQTVRSATQTALRGVLAAVKSKDLAKAKAAYTLAVRALSKAASRGAIPPARAARKVSRLTSLVKKALPDVFGTRR